MLEHEFTDDSQMYAEDVQSEILMAFERLQESDVDPFMDEMAGTHRSDEEFDPEREESNRHDEEQFNKLRHALIGQVHRINKQLRKRRFQKHAGKNTQFYCSQAQYQGHPPSTSQQSELPQQMQR